MFFITLTFKMYGFEKIIITFFIEGQAKEWSPFSFVKVKIIR